MVKLAAAHSDTVNFLLCNIEQNGQENAVKFGNDHKVDNKTLPHFLCQPPPAYGIRYIPHKVLIGKDGKVIKNYDNVDLSADVPKL